jgi:glutamate-1-semialdehyde 2,1-aminomutase
MMLDRGFLTAAAFYPTFAHSDENVGQYLVTATEVFSAVAESLRDDTVITQIRGPVAHTGFKRLT